MNYLTNEQKEQANTTYDGVVSFVRDEKFKDSGIYILEYYRSKILDLPEFSDGRSGDMYIIKMCYDTIDGRINLLKQIESDKDSNSKYWIALVVSVVSLLVSIIALLLAHSQQPIAP